MIIITSSNNSSNNSNNNNNHDNVYGAAVIMTKSSREFTWWMQTDCQAAANSHTKTTDLGCESAEEWLPPFAFTIAICYYYAVRKLILILPSQGRVKAESTWWQSSRI